MKCLVLTSMILLSGCAASNGPNPPGTGCLLFPPLTWSSQDTDETKRGIFTHNAKWLALCGDEPAE